MTFLLMRWYFLEKTEGKTKDQIGPQYQSLR